jgi:hypothetical protein
MAATPTTPQPKAAIRLIVSDDKMVVTLAAADDTAADGITPADALIHLEQASIFINPQISENLAKLAAETGKIPLASPVVVCEGLKPVDDTPAHIELAAPAPPPNPDEQRASHYDRTTVVMVTEGQVLGKFMARALGADGKDVFGHAVVRRKEPDHGKLGHNVALDADGTTVKAKAAGSLHCDGKTISVETVLDVPSNVDFSTGNINFTGDVVIHGGIADLFKVRGNTISVLAAVEAADVHALKDLEVIGGIVAKDKGQCRAGNNLVAKYIANANIQAGNDIVVQSELANSRVICGGKVSVERGAILAGHVTANGGIHCVALGSPAQVNTLVEVGFDQDLVTLFEQRRAEMEVQQKQVEKTRLLIDPLMRDPKHLTAVQKEKATELLYEADEVEHKIKSEIAELRKAGQAAASKCKAEITVAQIVHPGVVIRFPGLETRIRSTLKGPLKILPKEINGEALIVYQSSGGSAHPLETRSVKNASLEALNRLLASTSNSSVPVAVPPNAAN